MIDLRSERQKWIFLCAGAVCLLIALGLVVSFKGKFGANTARSATPVAPDEFEQPGYKAGGDMWAVYITGAVIRPGVYEVPEDSRVNDVLQKAGGFSIHANPEAINLAARVADGAHIRVPSKDAPDVQSGPSTVDSSGASVLLPSSSRRPETSTLENIDINSCTADDLLALPGIGPVLSQTIIKHRETNGPFESVESLSEVPGIGPKRLDAIRELVVVTTD